MSKADDHERRGGRDRDQHVQQDARLDDQSAQLTAVQDRITRLESRLQDLASLAERLAALEDQAGRLAQAQEHLAASQARIATLEAQVQPLQQGAKQAQERITELERYAGELATAVCASPRWSAAFSPLKSRKRSPDCLSASSTASEPHSAAVGTIGTASTHLYHN